MMTRLFAILMTLVICAAGARGQDTVRLRGSATAAAGKPVTLAEVAEIKGENSAALGAIVVIDALEAATKVDVALVRDAMKKQNVNLGRVLLSGAPCEVSVPGAKAREDAPTAPKKDEQDETAVRASGLRAADVRASIGAKLAELYGVEADHLRLTFERGQEELLDAPTAGRSVAVQPAAGGKRVPVQVRVYAGDRLERSGTVRVGVEVLREVLVTQSPVARGDALMPDAVITDERWLSTDVKPALYEETIGSLALSKIESGAIIESRMVQPPDCIAKGDICQVDCLTRGVAVQGQGRALEAGREGQVIRFQSMHSKKVFKARVSGAGRAVMEVAAR